MIRKTVAVLFAVLILICTASCSSNVKNNGNTDGTKVSGDFPLSLFEFDTRKTTKKLIDAFESGDEDELPVSVYVIYDMGGSLPGADSGSKEYIRSIYDALSEIQVMKQSDMSITDNYHCAAFTFPDGTSAAFNFEGENLLSIGTANYEVSGTSRLFTLIKSETLKDIDQ